MGFGGEAPPLDFFFFFNLKFYLKKLVSILI
jgi:hypothetical protein